jgi:lauroyl/myristoyl acyltransferase
VVAGNLEHVRRVVPARLVPAVVKRRLDKLWTVPWYREGCEEQMHWLLDHTDRAAEVPELAYLYGEQVLLRAYLRWHPRAITHQRVEGLEWLTTERDEGRGVVLNFMHHARWDGMFASLSRQGVELDAVISPKILGAETETAMRQHRRVIARGARIQPATGGTDALAGLVRPGAIVMIASDVPGQTPVTWLGRKVLGSFGAARIATMTDTPVVLVTARRDEAGSYLQVDPPLEPSDYAAPSDLLDDILRRHGEAVLAWPEAFEVPTARFGHIEE